MKHSSVDRKAFLASLASVGALAACSRQSGGLFTPEAANATAASVGARGGIEPTLLISNLTKTYADDAVYYYVWGLHDGAWNYLKPDGSIARVAKGLDLSIRLSDANKLALPRFVSGRILFALGKKLSIKVNDDGAPVTPAGWVKGHADYDKLFDFMEFTYDGGGLGANTTLVDMFGLPMTVHLTGARNQTVGPKPGVRTQIVAEMKANPPFDRLVVESGGVVLRVIAPGHGILDGGFPADYLDDYIEKCWNFYTNNSLNVVYEFGNPARTLTAVGRVDSKGQFAFTRDGKLVRSFTKPPTRDAFFCDGALLAPNDEGGKIAAILGAGFNRTNLLHGDASPQCEPAKFYTNPKTNTYSKILHQHAIGGVAYGFAFDDVCNLFSTYIVDPAPKQLEVTLGVLA